MKQLNLQTLFLDERLTATLEVLDTLHNAVSDGTLRLATTKTDQQLVEWLQEMVYTAQETLIELERTLLSNHDKDNDHSERPPLRVVEKPDFRTCLRPACKRPTSARAQV